MTLRDRFSARYGPWALVTGGSEGLGAAFADQLAARGLDLLLVARREDLLAETAADIERRHGVKVRELALDLSTAAGVEQLCEQAADLEVGLLVANAALAPIDPFLDLDLATHRRVLALNCRTACELAHRFGARMVARGRGGIVLVSSMSSFQGTALVAHYAATKAYLRVLAEGLWEELRPLGVDVLASCPGIVDTPAYRRSDPHPPRWLALTPLTPTRAAAETLSALGRGPVVVPGARNKLAGALTQRFLPRRFAVSLASSGTRGLYARPRGPARD